MGCKRRERCVACDGILSRDHRCSPRKLREREEEDEAPDEEPDFDERLETGFEMLDDDFGC